MPKFSIQLKLKKAALKGKKKRVKQHLYNKSIDKIKPQIDKTKTSRTILRECVRTYVIHLLGTYVTILYNWLIL